MNTSHAKAGHPTPVVIRACGVPEPFNLPWRLGVESGAFLREGIDLHWRDVPEGTGAMCELLHSGATDLAVLVTEGAVRDVLLNKGNSIVATLVDSPLRWGVHVGSGRDLHTPDDLVGVPFAISRFNSGSHLMAMVYAQRLGWTPKKEDFIVVHDLDGAIALLKSPTPAVFLWEQAMTAAFVEAGAFRNVDVMEAPWPAFTVVVRNEFHDLHPGEVERALRIVREQANVFIGQRHAPEQVMERYGLPESEARRWSAAVRWNMDGRIDLASLCHAARTLAEAGMLPGGPPEELWEDRLSGHQKPG